MTLSCLREHCQKSSTQYPRRCLGLTVRHRFLEGIVMRQLLNTRLDHLGSNLILRNVRVRNAFGPALVRQPDSSQDSPGVVAAWASVGLPVPDPNLR